MPLKVVLRKLRELNCWHLLYFEIRKCYNGYFCSWETIREKWMTLKSVLQILYFLAILICVAFVRFLFFFILYFLTKLAIFRPTLQNEMWYQVWPSTLLRFQINQVHLTPLGHYIFYSIMGIKLNTKYPFKLDLVV